MTYEPRERPRGLFGRFRNLMRAIFGGWIRGGELNNPRAVYESVIQERMKQYNELKQAVAGIVYMRNKLQAEISERTTEITSVKADIDHAVRKGDDELALALIGGHVGLHAKTELGFHAAHPEFVGAQRGRTVKARRR